MGITAHASKNLVEEQTTCFFDASLKVNGQTYFLICKNNGNPRIDPLAGDQSTLENPEFHRSSDSSVIVIGSEHHHSLLTQSILELSQAVNDANVSSHMLTQYCDELHQRLNELCFLRSQYSYPPSSTLALPTNTTTTTSSSSSSSSLTTNTNPTTRNTTLSMALTSTTTPPTLESNETFPYAHLPPIQIHVDKFGVLEQLRTIELNHQEQFIRRPQPRQYFLNGILHRSLTKMNVPWLELFHDLLFVGTLSSAGHVFQYGYKSKYLAQFTLLFFHIFKAWFNITLYNNQFHHQDVIHKLYTFLHMALLMSMAVNASHSFNQPESKSTASLFLASYLGVMYATMLARLTQAYFTPFLKWHIFISISCQFVTTWFYILAAVVPFSSFFIPIWIAGAILDLMSDYFTVFLIRVFQLQAHLALNIEHLAERFGLWVIICLGEVIVYNFFENDLSYNGLVYLAPILGLVVAFCIQAIYFELEEVAHEKHALRRNFLTSTLWTIVHLPLTWCIVVLGFAMASHHSLLTDSGNDMLKDVIDTNLMIWTLSACLLGVFFCFAIISILHLPLRSSPSSTSSLMVSKKNKEEKNPSKVVTFTSSNSTRTPNAATSSSSNSSALATATTTTTTTSSSSISMLGIPDFNSKTWVVFFFRCLLALTALIIGFVGKLLPPPFATGLAALICGMALVFEFFIQTQIEGSNKNNKNNNSISTSK